MRVRFPWTVPPRQVHKCITPGARWLPLEMFQRLHALGPSTWRTWSSYFDHVPVNDRAAARRILMNEGHVVTSALPDGSLLHQIAH